MAAKKPPLPVMETRPLDTDTWIWANAEKETAGESARLLEKAAAGVRTWGSLSGLRVALLETPDLRNTYGVTLATDMMRHDTGSQILNDEIAAIVKERWPDLAAEAIERFRVRANEALAACGLPPIPKDQA